MGSIGNGKMWALRWENMRTARQNALIILEPPPAIPLSTGPKPNLALRLNHIEKLPALRRLQ